jgi:SAM-dependent methyltransferase
VQPKHPWISALYNACDVPVRFCYCNLGPLSRLAQRALFWTAYSSVPRYLAQFHATWSRVFAERGVNLRGATVLELGPGNSYFNAFCFLHYGAARVILVDKYPRQKPTARQREYLRAEARFLREEIGAPEAETPVEELRRRGVFEHVEGDLLQLSLPPVDLIFSHSVLEHVEEPGAYVARMASALKPGGFACHAIDLRDHYNFGAPHLFLRFSDAAWKRWLTRPGLSYTNRWRYDDFAAAFGNAGFETLWEETTEMDIPLGFRLDSRFARKPAASLRKATLGVLLRRAGAETSGAT